MLMRPACLNKVSCMYVCMYVLLDYDKVMLFRTRTRRKNNHVPHVLFQVRFLLMVPDLPPVPLMDISTYGMSRKAKLIHSKATMANRHLPVGGRKMSCSCSMLLSALQGYQKYPVNDSILDTQRQQVSLCHVMEEFVHLSAILDFSEGILSFQCGETKPVKVLDVNEAGAPRMLTLPGIEPGMRVNVSHGASFIFGAKECK